MRNFINNLVAIIILVGLTLIFGIVGFVAGVVIWGINVAMMGNSSRKREHKELMKVIRDGR